MNNTFRPIEFWKSAVMTMPDNSFYELLRSVFGKIKTPFNKQQLLRELEIFLLREDIQKTISAYIDENDAKIIAAVALFGEPAQGELESFFSSEFNFAQLQDIIVNLEERFILYRFSEENINRLALNPVLEQALLPVTTDISALFPAAAETAPTAERGTPAIINDRILAALLSFTSQWQPFYRTEGIIRKQVIEAGKNHFPGIDLEPILGSMQALGLFYVDGDRLVPDKKLFNDLGALSVRERMEYCAAALIVYNEVKPQTEILPPLFRSRIRETLNFIHSFLDSLDAKLSYTEKTLKRLAEILKAKTGVTIGNTMFEVLEKTGLIVTASPELMQPGSIVQNTTEKHEGPFIAIDSGFSVLVYPEIGYADLTRLAGFLNIKEACGVNNGAVVRFELEKDSAVRAFDNNTSADEIIELLKILSDGRVDETFIWNLKDWEKRHSEVSLKKGVILTLSEDRRYLAETMPLAGKINETLAPGVYLLGENTMEAAGTALHNAGIDIIARNQNKKETNVSMYNQFPSPSSNILSEKISAAAANPGLKTNMPFGKSSDAGALTAEFHAILNKMPLGKTEHTELSARINRRLVLCEAQLKEATVRYEKLEARHMDYTGKQNIAKQAIAQQAPVEIIWPGSGKEKSFFGIPKALEKGEGELYLVVMLAGEQEVMRIPLAKISLLRRIKKSIFEK